MNEELIVFEMPAETADEYEMAMISKANSLMKVGFPEHSLLELWNASIHNLRRRVEMYSIDIFLSTISSLNGRKTYKKDGDTLSERWAGVDDLILIEGATQIGVLNKKAGQSLSMIDWMRNHASPSHRLWHPPAHAPSLSQPTFSSSVRLAGCLSQSQRTQKPPR